MAWEIILISIMLRKVALISPAKYDTSLTQLRYTNRKFSIQHKHQSLSVFSQTTIRSIASVFVITMHSDRTLCWLFIWPCMILLRFDLTALAYRIPFYSWSESSRRYLARSTGQLPVVIQPILIRYKLDAWSQYDNPEDGRALEGDIKVYSDSRKTTTTDKSRLWPNGIVRYFVDDTIVNEPSKLAVLDDAMDNIMEMTCVKFVRIYPDVNGQFPRHTWVNITGNEQGCFSDLGRSDLGPSNLNLDVRRCFRTRGHAMHEILHTLGVFHEHMRPDRDNYIKILWNNIKDGDEYNFRIMNKNAVTTYGLPYDYDSIMHYSMTAFSKDKSIPTIVPRKKDAEIGQRNHLSFYDVQKLLITYKCIDSDSKYHSDNIEFLDLNTSKGLPVTAIGRIHDYPYTKVAYPSTIPITWNPSHEFYYSEYLSFPHAAGYYYY